MGCCSRNNNQNNRKIKEWSNEENQNQIFLKEKLILIIPSLLVIAFLIYKFILN